MPLSSEREKMIDSKPAEHIDVWQLTLVFISKHCCPYEGYNLTELQAWLQAVLFLIHRQKETFAP